MYDATKVRALNDELRNSLTGGRVLLTPGITALSDVSAVLDRVKAFNDFTEDNNPYGEHDFGAFEHGGQQIFWKIDYYDADLNGSSPDPSDSAVTTRILTVLLAEEY